LEGPLCLPTKKKKKPRISEAKATFIVSKEALDLDLDEITVEED
jgi:hypothetical protein